MYVITFSKIVSLIRIISLLLLAIVIILRLFTRVYISDSTFWLYVFIAIPNIVSFFWDTTKDNESINKAETSTQE